MSTPAPAPVPNPPPAPSPDPAPPTPSPGPPPPPAFEPITSQEQFDRMIQERIARVKSTPPADYAELQAAAARLAEIETANQTELERERAAREAAEKRAQELETTTRETRLRSALLAEAARADRRVVDPEAVVQLLDRGSLDLDSDGVPTNAAQAVDQLLEARPYLVAPAGGARPVPGADQGARPSRVANQITEAELQTMTPEQIVQARKDGRLEDLGVGR